MPNAAALIRGLTSCQCDAATRGLGATLLAHIPFTAIGGLLGTLVLTAWWAVGRPPVMIEAFWASHLGHVFLSAAATTATFKLIRGRTSIASAVLVGMIGSVVLGTLSDAGLPYVAERALGWDPQHVHPAGLTGVALAFACGLAGSVLGWRVPASRGLHTLHVLVSVGASMAHLGLNGSDIAISPAL